MCKMKRIRFVAVSFVMLLCAFFGLASCGGNDKDKVPSSNYEKVQFAFNGVEKSFNESNLGKKLNSKKNSEAIQLTSYDISKALSTIDGVYVSGDSQGDVIDDLEYTQPPMIQFQCLKAVLDKVGNDYQFGTKYYDDITGEVYMDMTSGKKIDSSNIDSKNYKYAYTFRLSIDISIDNNDLIQADVSFGIHLEKGNEEYNTLWYVNMELDYDMKNTTPNYILTMRTSNDEHELSYMEGYTYEYDYVEVKDNRILEWRKFCLETNQNLVKDNNYNSINSYISDPEFSYKIGAHKWYKNNNLRKVTQMTESKKLTLFSAYYLDLGLNSTDIDSTIFMNKNALKTGTITTVYNEFSSIFKEDVIYNLLTSEDYENHDGGNTDASLIGIVVRNGNEKNAEKFENITLIGDPTLSDSLDEACSPTYWSGGACPIIYLVYNDNGREEKVNYEELGSLEYKLEIENQAPISLNQKISDVLLTLGDSIKNANSFDLIISYPNSNISVRIPCSIGDEIKALLQNSSAKDEVFELGFPLVQSNSAEYSKSNDLYIITGMSNSEAWGYRDTLENAGFKEVNSGNVYAKIVNDNKLLQAEIKQSKEATIQLKVRSDLSSTWNQELVDSILNNKLINITGPSGNQILFDYIITGQERRIIVYGLTDAEKEAYFESLDSDNQFTTTGLNSSGRVLRIMDTANNKFYEVPIIDNYNNLEIYLSASVSDFLMFKYKINDGEIKTFVPTYSKDERNISYNSEILYLNSEDVITFYGTNDMPIRLVEVSGGGAGDFLPHGEIELMMAPFTSSGYYIINYSQENYSFDERDMLWVQFFNAPDPNNPK